jgi:hypothetical protein
MSQLRKRERGPEAGHASPIVDSIQQYGRLKLKIEKGMAAPFKQTKKKNKIHHLLQVCLMF